MVCPRAFVGRDERELDWFALLVQAFDFLRRVTVQLETLEPLQLLLKVDREPLWILANLVLQLEDRGRELIPHI